MPVKQTHALHVPGGRLYYELRGRGPTLLLIPGSNGDAGLFDAVADLLADRFTVITYDRRGFSRSTLDGPLEAGWSETHVGDARRLLKTVATGPSHVFGSSAGAVVGLALISQSPDLVTRLIAHEPPLAEVLPDASEWRAFFEEVYETYRRDGAGRAMQVFMTGIGADTLERPAGVDPELINRLSGNLDFFLRHEVRQAPGYRPDLKALDAQQARITMAGGRDSRQHFPYRPSTTLANRWGKRIVDFPGDHTGYWSQPVEFAAILANALTGPTT
ncbi:alpha/beta hydrolase [Planotetraspora phitsanulokensis]|uniref:Putative hydrolase YraK n=1 Tax=Planotetraspora phitsanulokensis TaxID=575192 RepID=A0A8J3U0K5_9ACTN|nr:alpha/beta hydrolase [Planotetraspora phitsanulokensis]GII36268.1 putative hydrolase YraK [Planotetraspora phitsanulokensis]